MSCCYILCFLASNKYTIQRTTKIIYSNALYFGIDNKLVISYHQNKCSITNNIYSFMFIIVPHLLCLAGFAISIVHLHSDNRSPYDTKTRRARELRRRVNYLLKEEVEYFRKSPLFKRNTAVTKSCDSNDKNVPNNLRLVA